VNLSNARLNVVAALADYKVAEAELQKEMGSETNTVSQKRVFDRQRGRSVRLRPR